MAADYTKNVGDAPTSTATFRVSGTLTNPTTTTLKVKNPNGVLSTPSTSNPSTGVFTYTFDLSIPGLWSYQWLGDGACDVTLPIVTIRVLPNLS